MQLFSSCWETSPIAAQASAKVDPDEIFAAIGPLETTYPGFRKWFFGTVVPASYDERAVFVTKAHNRILGVGIAKRSLTERKLCTLWTAPAARDNGVALAIADRAFDWLETSHPLFTVPEERISEFQGLLKRWQFNRTNAVVGYYRPNKTEYVFNGRLQKELLS
jgi:hypothetical protein